MKFRTTDLTSKSRRGRIYQAVIGRFRTPRKDPRPDLLPSIVLEDPAPDWLVTLATDVLEHTGALPDAGALVLEQAIAWCEAGDAASRAAYLVPNETQPTKGRAEDDAYLMKLHSFLREAWKGSGPWTR